MSFAAPSVSGQAEVIATAQAVADVGTEVLGDDDRLRLMIRDHVRFVARHPEFVRIMHDVGKRPGPRTEWLVETHVAPLYRLSSTTQGRAHFLTGPGRKLLLMPREHMGNRHSTEIRPI